MYFSEAKIKQGDFLYQEINSRLASHLEPLTLVPKQILDLSLGMSSDHSSLRSHYPEAEYFSHDYFTTAQNHSGPQQLPFANASVDVIYANLSLHWLDGPQQLKEWRRVLRANGVILFSSFGPNSFQEYRQVWRDVGYDYASPQFIDLHDLGDALLKEGFASPVMEMESITLNYQSSSKLIGDVRNLIGLPTGRVPESSKLSPDQVKKALRALRETTIEIVYGHAFTPFSIYSKESKTLGSVIPIIQS